MSRLWSAPQPAKGRGSTLSVDGGEKLRFTDPLLSIIPDAAAALDAGQISLEAKAHLAAKRRRRAHERELEEQRATEEARHKMEAYLRLRTTLDDDHMEDKDFNQRRWEAERVKQDADERWEQIREAKISVARAKPPEFHNVWDGLAQRDDRIAAEWDLKAEEVVSHAAESQKKKIELWSKSTRTSTATRLAAAHADMVSNLWPSRPDYLWGPVSDYHEEELQRRQAAAARSQPPGVWNLSTLTVPSSASHAPAEEPQVEQPVEQAPEPAKEEPTGAGVGISWPSERRAARIESFPRFEVPPPATFESDVWTHERAVEETEQLPPPPSGETADVWLERLQPGVYHAARAVPTFGKPLDLSSRSSDAGKPPMAAARQAARPAATFRAASAEAAAGGGTGFIDTAAEIVDPFWSFKAMAMINGESVEVADVKRTERTDDRLAPSRFVGTHREPPTCAWADSSPGWAEAAQGGVDHSMHPWSRHLGASPTSEAAVTSPRHVEPMAELEAAGWSDVRRVDRYRTSQQLAPRSFWSTVESHVTTASR